MNLDKVFILLSTAFFCGNLACSLLTGSGAVPVHGIHRFLCLTSFAGTASAALVLSPLRSMRVVENKAFGRCSYIAAMAATFFFIGATGYGIAAVTEHLSQKRAFAEGCAAAIKDSIDSIGFDNNECNALVKALMTGDRSSLTPQVKENFRKSGASHILALSGMHLGIIYLLMGRILGILGNSIVARRIRSGIVIGVAGFYTLMTGAGDSLVRAFLFILIAQICSMTGRKSVGMRTLCAALMLQLIFDPLAVSSVGFQLSYLAMSGIYILFPVMEKWYPEGRKGKAAPLRKIWSLAALSISCQVFTAPLVWVYFRSFPVYFLITNLIAMPLTTIVMMLSIACTALTGLGICPGFLVRADEAVIETLMFSLEVIAGL